MQDLAGCCLLAIDKHLALYSPTSPRGTHGFPGFDLDWTCLGRNESTSDTSLTAAYWQFLANGQVDMPAPYLRWTCVPAAENKVRSK